MENDVLSRRVEAHRVWGLLGLAAVSLFSVLGLYLRYTYARTSSPYIDEYTTMWVAQRTIEHGYPVFSTGALYAQGLLFTYLDAMFIRLFGFSELVARMPSLILSVGCIPLSYWLGRRMFSQREGLLVCALMAVDPQSIIWGGRARNYTLLAFLVLLVLYFSYRGVVAEDRPAYRRLALLFLLGAVYSHNEAILLFPAVVVVSLLWRGWRWFVRPAILGEHLLAVLGMTLSWYLYGQMRPKGWVSLGEGRPAFSPSLDLLGAIDRYSRFFLGPDQVPFVALVTLFFLAAFGYLIAQAWRRGAKRVLDPDGEQAGLAFLSVMFLVPMIELVFVVGERRWGARYLFMLTPVFFLIATSMLMRVLEFLAFLLDKRGLMLPSILGPRPSRPWGTVVACFLAALVALFALPAALSAANRQEYGYDLAFKHVREQRIDGDKVMSFNLSACMLYLDERCDYVSVQEDFHAYATQAGGEWIGAWGGLPILFTDYALEEAIEQAPRMWFVIDEARFRTRYTSHFIQYVWDHMELVAREGRVFVFLAENPPPPALPLQHSTHLNFDDRLALLGYGLSGDALRPGDQVRLRLRWQGSAPMVESYSVFVHLVDASNSVWTQNDGAPLGDLYPTIHWVPGETISDDRALTLPADIPPGRYRLEVGVYVPESLEHLVVLDEAGNYLGDRITLDFVHVWEEPPESFSPQQAVNANLANEVTLWGYDMDTRIAGAGDTLHLVLYWKARRKMEEDYTVFVHLIDGAGRIWGQEDSQPENGFYPTSHWDVGEAVRDETEFSIEPGAPPGVYQIEVGMYLLSTGERLQYVDEASRIVGSALVLEDVRLEG